MKRARGFTLIELVVGLAIIALMMSCCFEGLRFASRAWSAVTARMSGADEVWTSQNFVRARIEQLQPAMALEGTERDFRFFSSLPFSQPQGVRPEFRFATAQAKGRLDLQVLWRVKPNDPWREETLLKGIRSAHWAYFKVGENVPSGWVSSWHKEEGVPQLIRFAVEMDGGDRRYWPTLFVRPRLTADFHCVFDFVSRQCPPPA